MVTSFINNGLLVLIAANFHKKYGFLLTQPHSLITKFLKNAKTGLQVQENI